MTNQYYSTKQVAAILSIRADNLQRAVWLGKVNSPQKSPSGHYLWTEHDIESAAWSLHRTAHFNKHFRS